MAGETSVHAECLHLVLQVLCLSQLRRHLMLIEAQLWQRDCYRGRIWIASSARGRLIIRQPEQFQVEQSRVIQCLLVG